MNNEEKILAVLARMETRLESMEGRMESMEGRMEGMEGRIGNIENDISGIKLDIENRIDPALQTLADGLSAVNGKLKALPDPDLMEKMQDELDLHHQMLKIHTDEIKRLKKAQ